MDKRTARLRRLLEQKLGVRGRTLAQALRRARGQLPRRLRGPGETLIDAESMAGNPKLARMLDTSAIHGAFDQISAHLETIDLADVRKGRILGVLGSIAFNLLVVVIALIVFMWWRGHI